MWCYVLTTVGPERIYVCMGPPSTAHAGDCMFIAPEVVEGILWYVAYGGRAVPNEEGQQELERPFGMLECMSGKPMLCREERQGPQWHGSGFMVCTRHEMYSCGGVLTCMASWDSTAFLAGLSDACGVCVCVCVLLQALCIFGLNCFLAGLSDAIECNCRIAI